MGGRAVHVPGSEGIRIHWMEYGDEGLGRAFMTIKGIPFPSGRPNLWKQIISF